MLLIMMCYSAYAAVACVWQSVHLREMKDLCKIPSMQIFPWLEAASLELKMYTLLLLSSSSASHQLSWDNFAIRIWFVTSKLAKRQQDPCSTVASFS